MTENPFTRARMEEEGYIKSNISYGRERKKYKSIFFLRRRSRKSRVRARFPFASLHAADFEKIFFEVFSFLADAPYSCGAKEKKKKVARKKKKRKPGRASCKT